MSSYPAWWKVDRKGQLRKLQEWKIRDAASLVRCARRWARCEEEEDNVVPMRSLFAFVNEELGGFKMNIGEGKEAKQISIFRHGRKEAMVHAPSPIPPPLAYPPECICPLTWKVFVYPVVAFDGVTYERQALVDWFAARGSVSPVTGEALPTQLHFHNRAMQAVIRSVEEERVVIAM